MGTNYYAALKKPTLYEAQHLGKSSAGWRFLFRETDEIKTFPQFKQWLEDNVGEYKDYVILDEYEKEIDKEELLELIEEKQESNHPGNFDYGCKNIDGYRFKDDEFC